MGLVVYNSDNGDIVIQCCHGDEMLQCYHGDTMLLRSRGDGGDTMLLWVWCYIISEWWISDFVCFLRLKQVTYHNCSQMFFI